MEHEFGTGLRAHLGRKSEPELDGARPLPLRTSVEVEPPRVPPTPRPDLDARIDALATAEAELNFRERRLLDRELEFHVAVQKTVYMLAQQLVEGGMPALPEDELASLRARRRGFAA